LGFSIAMATISYFALERPLQRYRRNLGHQHRAGAKPMPAGDDRAPQTAIIAATT